MASVPQGYRNSDLHDPPPRPVLFAGKRNILVFADCSRPRRKYFAGREVRLSRDGSCQGENGAACRLPPAACRLPQN